MELYPNLSKKLRGRIQTLQNKCIRFCLQLNKMSLVKMSYLSLVQHCGVKSPKKSKEQLT